MEKVDKLQPYFISTEDSLLKRIKEQKEYIFKKERILENCDHYIKMYLSDIERLEKKEPHKYQNHIKYLEILLEKCQYLEQKLLVEYRDYISIITDEKPIPKIKNEEREKYFNEIFEYLGKKVGYIRHIDREYKVKSINLITGDIKTEEGKIIRLMDLGTGHGSSAYFIGLLNMSDKRTVIALFDEVAMMDTKSLEPIYDKFRELYSKNKLLLGIVVQKSDNVNIISKLTVGQN
jgi:exonuclease SbcC